MPLITELSIQRIFDDNRDTLQLGWFAGFSGGEKLITDDATASSDQVGHLNLIHIRDGFRSWAIKNSITFNVFRQVRAPI